MAAPARQLPERERRSSMVLRSTRSDGHAAKDERNDRFAQSRLRGMPRLCHQLCDLHESFATVQKVR